MAAFSQRRKKPRVAAALIRRCAASADVDLNEVRAQVLKRPFFAPCEIFIVLVGVQHLNHRWSQWIHKKYCAFMNNHH